MEEINNKTIRYLSRLASHEMDVFLNLQQEFCAVSKKSHLNKVTLSIKVLLFLLIVRLMDLVFRYQAPIVSFLIFGIVALVVGVLLIKEISLDVRDIHFLSTILKDLKNHYTVEEYKNKDKKLQSIAETIFAVKGKDLRFELNTKDIDSLLYIYNNENTRLMLINLKHHTQIVYCEEGKEIVKYYSSLQ